VSCERLRKREVSESGGFEHFNFFGRSAPFCYIYKFYRVWVGRIAALEQRVIPSAKSFRKVVEDAVGTLLGHIDEYYTASGGQLFVGFADNIGQTVDIARCAVEKYGIVVAVSEIGIFGS